MKNDIERLLADVLDALTFLSRLPFARNVRKARGANAAWAWPVAGLILAGIAGVVAALASWLGFGAGASAVVALTILIVATGALHEDGLADSFDGLWGGWTRERRLEIMRDSRIGTYGVIALVLSIVARWTAISALIAAGSDLAVAALFIAAATSRAAMTATMVLLPNARDDGLSKLTGRPSNEVATASVGIAGLVAVALGGWSVLFVVPGVGIIAWGWARVAKSRIGGQTGDILGASQQLCEITALLVLAACWA